MRRSIIHTLKQETGAKIFPNLAKYQDISMKERRMHLAFRSALLFPGDDKVRKVAPILFEDGKKNMKKMFKCKHLVLVGVAMMTCSKLTQADTSLFIRCSDRFFLAQVPLTMTARNQTHRKQMESFGGFPT
jgi:hypothetical protein